MPKRTRDYRTKFLEDLRDTAKAVNYLNAALDDSEEMFLLALRDVAESYRIAKIAEDAGLAREALYRSLSAEGNPRFSSLTSILAAMNLKITIEAREQPITPSANMPAQAPAAEVVQHNRSGPSGFLSRLGNRYSPVNQAQQTEILAYANQ